MFYPDHVFETPIALHPHDWEFEQRCGHMIYTILALLGELTSYMKGELEDFPTYTNHVDEFIWHKPFVAGVRVTAEVISKKYVPEIRNYINIITDDLVS